MNDAQILWDLEATPPSSILVIIPRDFYKNIYFSMSNNFWLMCSFDNNSKSCSLFCMVKKINIGVLSLNHLKHNLRSLWELVIDIYIISWCLARLLDLFLKGECILKL